jgi:hypothetical protein
MNCGASLLAFGRKQEARKKYSVLSDSRIISRKSTPTRPVSEDFKPWDNFEISTDDNFVKPSKIARDRIRSSRTHRIAASEMDKAKHAFERAEEVGIVESGTGVIETRMLRASEVRELLSDWGTSEQTESSTVAEPPNTHSLPDRQEEMEQRFLGSQSALTNLGYSEKQQARSSALQVTTPSDDFSSTLYQTEESQQKQEQVSKERKLGSTVKAKSGIPSESTDVSAETPPWAVICPDCGKVMISDLYDYPNDVYSQMGDARLKQAKYLFIQGKPEEALKAARFSRLFFEKAKDERGLIQLVRLERLLGPTN